MLQENHEGGSNTGNRTEAIHAKVADALVRIAPRDPRCTPAYAPQLTHHQDAKVRMNAAMVLGSFGEDGAGAVPQLMRALADKNQVVVGMIGPKAKGAVPELQRLAAGQDKGVVATARAAPRQIQRPAGQ
jgi:HEAT repeat protein